MFTGLIEEKGNIKGIQRRGNGIILEVTADIVLNDLKQGDSISIDGVCLTVTDIGRNSFSVFVSDITSSVTTLSDISSGFEVNLERALSLGSRLGGHIVQGHVDGKGVIDRLNKNSNGVGIDISVPQGLLKYIVLKGSVAVNGISLTVVSINRSGLKVYVIPETLNKTTVDKWKANTEVNIEVDLLAKYVEKMLDDKNEGNVEQENRLLKGKLFEEGFM